MLEYIHLNPVRARLVQPEFARSTLDYPWSSRRARLRPAAGQVAPMAGG